MKTQNKFKIVILVLSSNQLVAKINRMFQKISWVTDYPNVKIIFYLGGYKKTELVSNDTLKLTSSKKFKDIGVKTIDSFEWVDNNLEYDFIFRTSASSFLFIPKLIEFVNKNFDNIDYSGVVAQAKYLGKDIKFASGSGYFVSKKIVSLILNNKDLWNHKLIDDVALGEFLKEFNIEPFNFERNSINVFPSYESMNYELFLTRCKINQFNLPRILEAFYMLKLKNNYMIFNKNLKYNKNFEKINLFFIKIIQKFYPRKLFPQFQNLHYKRYLKDLNN